MADVIASRAQIVTAMKEVYGEKIAELPNRTPWIYNAFEKSTKKTGGKYWTVPVLSEGGQAVGSYNDDEEVADAQAEVTKEMKVTNRYHYGTIRVTGPAMAEAKTNLTAFINTKDFEIRNKTKWLISLLNVEFYGAGLGVLGVVASAADTPDSITFVAGTNMNWFRKNMKVDVYDTTLAAARRNFGDLTSKKKGWQITSVDKVNLKINLGAVNPATAGVVATDKAVLEDSQIAPSQAEGKAILGLAALVDDTTEAGNTVQNIDRTVYTDFKSTVLANGGTNRPLSLQLIQKFLDSIEVDSGETPDFMVGGYGVRQAYVDLLWHDARYVPQTFKGGFQVLQYGAIPWVVDKDSQDNRIYAGRREYLHKFISQPLGILNDAGTDIERIPKTDVYELLIGAYMNLGHLKPNAWGKLLDIEQP